MATSVPTAVMTPALQDFPFLNNAISREPATFTMANGSYFTKSKMPKEVLQEQYFRAPHGVCLKQIAPISSMTDQTFEQLFSILQPSFDGTQIQSKAGLEGLAATAGIIHLIDEEFFDDDEYLHEHTLQQLCGFVLFHSNIADSVQWHKLAELYNNSEPGQQSAIYQYFDSYHYCELDYLLEITGKPLMISEAFDEPFESKTHEGDTYLYSDVLQDWLREDVFQQQYRIDFVVKKTGDRNMVCVAPTLKQAVVKVMAHVFEDDYSPSFWCCEIIQGGRMVATADLVAIDRDKPYHERPAQKAKLRWDFDNLGAAMEKAEIIKREGMTPRKIEEMFKYTTPINKEAFFKTLLVVEKAFGVQWSKVSRLEDELGL